MRKILYVVALALSVHAQTCDNFGEPQGATCTCPVGFGGSTCAQPGCGGTIFQGAQRPLASTAAQSSNLTAAGCSCANGWTGTGCNVCQTADSCQSAFVAAGSVSGSPGLTGAQGNDTMVCNTESRVWASSQMSCKVEVRLSLSTFFGLSILTICRIPLYRVYTPSRQPSISCEHFNHR